MPINSYLSPLGPSAATPPTENSGRDPTSPHPGIQRLNSHSSQNSATDRRRRGSSLGNLFSSFTSSLRQQAPLSASGTPPNSNQIPNNSSSVSISSTVNAISIPPLSHQPSTNSIGASHTGSSHSSTGNNNNANPSLSLLLSSTITDLQQLNLSRNDSSYSVPAINNLDLTEVEESMGPLDDLEEETEEQARTRQNSVAVTPALAESVHDKKEPDGSFSIRLTPFIDHSSSSPALYFSPLIRRLKPGMRLSVGRYTEKNREAAQAPQGSSAGLVFKSKVVSRTHLEILVDEHGNWYIKDLKSSSGTFLNHIRLSPAGIESEDCMICDGDILQLGMDFRGGSEEIFRCVKVRIELNKSWKRKTHKFNRDAHKKLLGEETECCICLNDLKVGDSIFISPCSHSWHYKCVRPLLVRNYPQFHCPNCRSITDLEEDDEDDD